MTLSFIRIMVSLFFKRTFNIFYFSFFILLLSNEGGRNVVFFFSFLFLVHVVF